MLTTNARRSAARSGIDVSSPGQLHRCLPPRRDSRPDDVHAADHPEHRQGAGGQLLQEEQHTGHDHHVGEQRGCCRQHSAAPARTQALGDHEDKQWAGAESGSETDRKTQHQRVHDQTLEAQVGRITAA